MTPFTGGWFFNIPSPGQDGGWVPWVVKGVLLDEGDHNPNDDAIAEVAGITWVPPANEAFTYDDDGNRESSSLWDYGWDGRNMLVSATTKNYSESPEGWRVTCDYDAEGRRFKKTIIHKTTRAEQVKETLDNVTFIWDGWNLIYERHANELGTRTLDRKYVWGEDIGGGTGGASGAGGAGGLLLIRETRGQAVPVDYYPLYDGSGHVVGLTDSAGTLVAQYTYGPFGELISASGPMADANPIRYATKYYDKETGLYYFGRRYYDPATGQWLNREPLGEDESLNLYAYTLNDPVNNVDRLGLDRIWIGADGTTKWVIEDMSSGIFGLFRKAIGWIPVGSAGANTPSSYSYGSWSPSSNLPETPIALSGGGTVSLSELQSFAKANPLSSYSTHWAFSDEQVGLVGKLVERVAGGAARSENGVSEFFAGVHDQTGNILTGIDGLIMRDGLLGSDFLNWERWTTSTNNPWKELYGNSVFKTSPATIREQRYGWVANQNTGYYQGGQTTTDVVALLGPGAWRLASRGSGYVLAAKVTPNPRTGVGYGVTDPPVRVQGIWTEADFKAALQGRPPSSLGRPDLHHAEQMPGSAIHEVLPDVHRGNPALHSNRYNQGVTPQMRNQDRQLHWWYRAREEGADQLYPDLIYDN